MVLTLAGNFTLFTTANYNDVEQAVCDAIGRDRSTVNVDELRSGSIVIGATMSIDNIAQQTSLISALKTALATNSSLAGFTIESSTLTAVTGDAGALYGGAANED